MKLNIQEIRKQPEGLHFEQALDLMSKISLQWGRYSTKTVCIS